MHCFFKSQLPATPFTRALNVFAVSVEYCFMLCKDMMWTEGCSMVTANRFISASRVIWFVATTPSLKANCSNYTSIQAQSSSSVCWPSSWVWRAYRLHLLSKKAQSASLIPVDADGLFGFSVLLWLFLLAEGPCAVCVWSSRHFKTNSKEGIPWAVLNSHRGLEHSIWVGGDIFKSLSHFQGDHQELPRDDQSLV